MIHFVNKFGFVHRRLWQQRTLYRAALLFGPAPLLGSLLAAGLWAAVQALGGGTKPVPWAPPNKSETWHPGQGDVVSVRASRPLPATAADGALPGYEPGWRATANPIQISPAMDVDVERTPLLGFTLGPADLDMTHIIAEGPKGPLYVAVGSGFLAVMTAGTYALTARIERPAGQPADCLIRLGFGQHRIVSNFEIGMVNNVSKTYDSVRFDLQPGLYSIGWAFGCWRGRDVTAPGRMIILIRHPGDPTLEPAATGEIVRPQAVRP